MNTGLPLEIVAAVTAAVAVMIDQPVGSFVVSSISPEPGAERAAAPTAAVWSKAGILESHLMRRQFGMRTR